MPNSNQGLLSGKKCKQIRKPSLPSRAQVIDDKSLPLASDEAQGCVRLECSSEQNTILAILFADLRNWNDKSTQH
eukprot:2447094-Amphidinium_carterae.1